MKKVLIIFFTLFLNTISFASIKESIIKNLINVQNLNFDFEQNINGKIETGKCTIEYPKKIFCEYILSNEKILASNGTSLVIKTKSSYYKYPITNTPLNYILDKKFLINQIKILNERIIDNKFVNFKIINDGNEINIFFDKDSYNLVGWQTLDIYQNLNITFLSSIKINQILERDIFKLPLAN
jgi:outer membrane lipoprotein-sorting protein